MATSTEGSTRSYKSTNDLSAKQYYIVKLSSGQIVLASAATDFLIGSLENKPKAGETGSVKMRHGGATAKVIAGGSISVGDHITSDASGKAVATTTGGDEVLGRALEAADSGDIFEYMPSIEKYRTS